VLEPEYGENVVEVLDKIEYDPGRKALWNAICDAIDLVCDQPDSAEARKDGLALPSSGTKMWMVPIRCSVEDDDWVLVWFREADTAIIQYIDPRGFRSVI